MKKIYLFSIILALFSGLGCSKSILPNFPGEVADQEKKQNEFNFVSVEKLYAKTLHHENDRVRTLAKKFLMAIKVTNFFPSPEGLEAIMAMGYQESSLLWDPKIYPHKKKKIKKKFQETWIRLDSEFINHDTGGLLCEELKAERKNLENELAVITDPKNKGITEYQYYLWTRKLHRFFNKVIKAKPGIVKIGKSYSNIDAMVNRIAHEPKTFGLWQINVNNLKERLELRSDLVNKFPRLYLNQDSQRVVDRDGLVACLSGTPNAPLSKQKTLELIIYAFIIPRYNNHLRGTPDDVCYFVGENLCGDFSSYRAPIQSMLNKKLNKNLVEDGDLSYSCPYSIQIDWSRESNTQKALKEFINTNKTYFSSPVQPDALVKALCEAVSWDQLQTLELYKVLMGKNAGQRMFPKIRSTLYGQSPEDYVKKVMENAR